MSVYRNILLVLLVAFVWTSCKDSVTAPDRIPPTLELPPSLNAIAGVEFTQVIPVNDPQGLNVTLFAEGLPGWLELVPQQSLLRGTPTVDDAGIYEIKIIADNDVVSAEVDVVIRVFVSQKELGLQEHVESAMSIITPGLRGLSVAVVDADGNSYSATVGHMGSSRVDPPIQKDNLFRVASVNKPMTAALILKLANDGKLNLDDRITDHIESYLQHADRMTIRHLLTHTAGLYDHLNSNSFWGHSTYTPRKYWTLDEVINMAIANGPRFSPGQSYGYSNTGFFVLAKIVEEITGIAIEDAYEQMLFGPMGLENILYDDYSGPGNTIPGLAFNTRTYEYHLTAAGPAGAVAGSAPTVAKLGWNLYGGRFVSEELSLDMGVNYGARLGGQNYGLGTRIWTVGGIRHYGHTGSLMNYRNILMYIPELDISIAMHTHEAHAGWFPLTDSVFEHVVANFTDQVVKRLPHFMWAGETRE
jgi:D-alanyl-D-alanine carboxypeptidase